MRMQLIITNPFILSEDIMCIPPLPITGFVLAALTHHATVFVMEGLIVTFSGEQTLYGSYGGTEGKTCRANKCIVGLWFLHH